MVGKDSLKGKGFKIGRNLCLIGNGGGENEGKKIKRKGKKEIKRKGKRD